MTLAMVIRHCLAQEKVFLRREFSRLANFLTKIYLNLKQMEDSNGFCYQLSFKDIFPKC